MIKSKAGLVAHAFDPSTWKAEAGGSLTLRPGWSTEFEDSQCYTEKPCLKNKQRYNQVFEVN